MLVLSNVTLTNESISLVTLSILISKPVLLVVVAGNLFVTRERAQDVCPKMFIRRSTVGRLWKQRYHHITYYTAHALVATLNFSCSDNL